MLVSRIFGRSRGISKRLFEFHSTAFTPYGRKSPEAITQEVLVKRSIQKVQGKAPRRAILYVPGNDQRKIEKISSLNVDCAVLDCEDGVAVNRKKEARETISKCLPELQETAKGEICVRINSVSSELYQDDLGTILDSKIVLQAVMLPKVEKWEEIDAFFACINPLLKARSVNTKIRFVIFVETALGLVNLKEIIESTIAYSSTSKLYFEGIVFGSDDFCASIGVQRSSHSNELLYARQKIVTHAKAYDLQAIDMVYIDYNDMEGLEKQSLEGVGLGFTGKQVIHPRQVEVVQKCFSPSQQRIDWATELIQAFNEHQDAGKGAFTFHGRMIDMPLLKQAQSILNLSTFNPK